MIKPADVLFLLIEVGSWATIGVAIFKRDKWSRLDAYWLWIGSPFSVVASLMDGLWLYAVAWTVWIPALLWKRARREKLTISTPMMTEPDLEYPEAD